MLWSFFHLDNMDEKEQADRLAAAEALYMISTRVNKGGPAQTVPRRGRRKKSNSDFIEDSSVTRKGAVENGDDETVNNGRGRGKRGPKERRGGGGRGGCGSRGGASSPRGRGGSGKSSSSTRRHQRQSFEEFNDRTVQIDSVNLQLIQNSTSGGIISQQTEDREQKLTPKKIRNNRKKSSSPAMVGYSCMQDLDDKSHQTIGFTGAAISIGESSSRRSSFDSSQNLQSPSKVLSSKQVGALSRSLSSTIPVMYGLPSINLTSFTSDLNLPSIPLEIGSLQLSSKPTPNLSSLGDMGEGVMEDDFTSAGRKSEKFLPLKKRKLLNPSEAETTEPTPSMEALSDFEERSGQSPPSTPIEPTRASFTVQATPMITMQTLMEIKTALTADDDGDLPLHIAVVHENMRMVIKLISLMRIAGKGVDKFNKQQQTPLHLAVKLNFLEAIEILLKSKANVNAVDCTGSSCIHMAVQGRSSECLRLLLESCPNADLNVRNFDGLPPLHIAVDNGDLEQVETLLKYDADIDVTDGKSGRTALFRAAESNQKTMVELLLSKGANPDVPNYAGVTTAMAAQGRNLHGVLKLLGSAATDKFTEFEMKPNLLALESKPSPILYGFPQLGSFSTCQPSKSAVQPKQNGHEITSLLESKVNSETGEIPSNEIKVFHNVFVLSQNQGKGNNSYSKSLSEPSSPEVKKEVIDDKEAETYGRSGLLSLPEGVFSNNVEENENKPLIKQMVEVTPRQSGSLFSSPMKLSVPVIDSSGVRKIGMVNQRGEHKSLMLQIVPSSTYAPKMAFSSLITSKNTVAPESTKALGTLLKSVLTRPPLTPSSSSTVNPSAATNSSSDTVTLTGMQARLFQMLLKRYNIDPANEVASGNQQILSPSSSASPKLLQPAPSSSLSKTASSLLSKPQSPTAIAISSMQGKVAQSTTQLKSNAGSLILNSGDNRGTPRPQSSHQQTQLSQKLLENRRNSYELSARNGVHIEGDGSKMDESPLNLSIASNRQGKQEVDDREKVTVSIKLEEAQPTSRTVTGVVPVLGSGQYKPKRISPGLGKFSDSDKGGTVQNEGNGQYRMILLPASEKAQSPASVSVGKAESTISTSRVLSNASLGRSVAKLPEQFKYAGEIEQDLHQVTTSVSQNTASKVRDYLSQPSRLRFRNNSSKSLLTAASSPGSPVQASVPTVLDLASDAESPTLKRQIITSTSNSSTFVTLGKGTSQTKSPVSSTVLLPTVSTSPIFLQQGQVIDLSKNRLTSSNQSSPSVSSDTGQGKVIGFSGAIISVVPPKLDQSEKQIPKEMTFKEVQKKRGRKSQKSVQGLSNLFDAGLCKINSETDEKLKKFLGAKMFENASSVLPNVVLGSGDELTSDGLEDSELLGEYSEIQADQTYKTVGIFSGDVQRVKVGKKIVASPSTLQATPLSETFPAPLFILSPVVPSLTDDKQSGCLATVTNFELNTKSAPLSELDLSKFAVTTDTGNKFFSKEISIKAEKIPSNSIRRSTKTDMSNFIIYKPDNPSKSVANLKQSLEADQAVLKKSKRRSKKPSYIVRESKERIAAMLSKKGQSLQTEKGTENSSRLMVPNTEEGISSKAKTNKLSEEVSSAQKRKRRIKNKLVNASQPMKKSQDVNNMVQTLTSESDFINKQTKRQRKKKSEHEKKKRISKLVLVNKNELVAGKVPKMAVSDHDLAGKVNDTKVDNQNIFPAHLNVRKNVESSKVLKMEVDDDSDVDEQPNLVIEESEEMN